MINEGAPGEPGCFRHRAATGFQKKPRGAPGLTPDVCAPAGGALGRREEAGGEGGEIGEGKIGFFGAGVADAAFEID